MDTNVQRELLDTINMKKAIVYRVRAEMASAKQQAGAAQEKARAARSQVDRMQADFKAMKKDAEASKGSKKAELKALSKKVGDQSARMSWKK